MIADAKLQKIQAEIAAKFEEMLFEDDSASKCLKKMHELFPLDKANMPKEFKGTHSITLKDGKVSFNIWWEGHAWSIDFTPTK